MTTELEKQFFQCFGIEPKYQDTCTVEEKYWQNEELANEYGTFDQYMNAKCGNQENCSLECSCAYQKEIYPQITDRHYLELIVIHNIYIGMKLYHLDIKGLKEEILQDLIDEQELRDIKKEHVSDDFKHQVQQLFKE